MSDTPTTEKRDIPAEARAYLARIGRRGGKQTGETKSRSAELRAYWADVRAGKIVRVGWQPTN